MKKRLPEVQNSDIRVRVILSMKSIMATHPTIRSRKAFAEVIGTTGPAISRWESGTGNPTLEDVAMMCTRLNISADYLITGQGSQYGDAELNTRLTNCEKRIMDLEKRLKI